MGVVVGDTGGGACLGGGGGGGDRAFGGSGAGEEGVAGRSTGEDGKLPGAWRAGGTGGAGEGFCVLSTAISLD